MTIERHLYTPREAAQMMGISYPTIKKCILDGRLKTIKTPGGHHRLAPEEIKAFSERDGAPPPVQQVLPQISRTNQLRGQVISIQSSGLVAEVILSIGDQRMRAIIDVASVEDLELKPGDTAAVLIKAMDIMIGRF